MTNRISRTAAVVSLVGLFALAPASSAKASQGETPSAERALLGRTAASFGVSEGSPQRVLDGTRALLGREIQGNAPVVGPGRSRWTVAGGVSGVDGQRALLAAPFRPGDGWTR